MGDTTRTITIKHVHPQSADSPCSSTASPTSTEKMNVHISAKNDTNGGANNNSHVSSPFPLETTLTFQALHHWARVDPHRTALIYTEQEWKVDHGTLVGSTNKTTDLHQQKQHNMNTIHHKNKTNNNKNAPIVTDESHWNHMTYGELFDRVHRLRVALHQAGIPVPTQQEGGSYRVLILWMPPNRAELMALVLALQAAGCVLLFGTPDAFGGIRGFFRAMLELEPDGVLCSRVGYALFRSVAATIISGKHKRRRRKRSAVAWIHASQLVASLQDNNNNNNNNNISNNSNYDQQQQPPVMPDLPLDTVTSIMFSGGTTGDPTPIEVTHRMLCSQAANYAGLLQRHGIFFNNSNRSKITGTYDDDHHVIAAQRHGPWTSAHIFLNFVMLDLVLGGTAVLQPMGLAMPEDRVCSATFTQIVHHFQAQVTSAPPALWTRMVNSKQELASLKVACLGGAETSATFAKQVTQQALSCSTNSNDNNNDQQLATCEFYRVYGTTQVLPIAIARGTQVVKEEAQHCVCATGGGVCLGTAVEGLNVAIDIASWEKHGGRSRLEGRKSGVAGAYSSQQQECYEVGELCVYGTVVSPSCEEAIVQPHDKLTVRKFATGDICYIDPDSQHIHFLGRKAQAIDCGPRLKMVPPVGVEMVCLESQAIARCAFVGIPPNKQSHGHGIPVIVVQFHEDGDDTITSHFSSSQHHHAKQLVNAADKIRKAVANSIWSELLKVGLKCAVYPKAWPVDGRHSSKINRHLLRGWAAKLHSHKLVSV